MTDFWERRPIELCLHGVQAGVQCEQCHSWAWKKFWSPGLPPRTLRPLPVPGILQPHDRQSPR